MILPLYGAFRGSVSELASRRVGSGSRRDQLLRHTVPTHHAFLVSVAGGGALDQIRFAGFVQSDGLVGVEVVEDASTVEQNIAVAAAFSIVGLGFSVGGDSTR